MSRRQLAIAVAMIVALMTVELGLVLAVKADLKPQRRCQEDESCWDCRTMGNHICGPRP